MASRQETSVKAGMFLVFAGAVVVLAVFFIGRRRELFQKRYMLLARFSSAQGLVPGAAVRVAGVDAGTVRSVRIDPVAGNQGAVSVELELSASYKKYIQTQSCASVRTLGALGDKYVDISLGSQKETPLKPGDSIRCEDTIDLYEIAGQTRTALVRVNAIAEDVAKTLNDVDREQIIHRLAQSAEQVQRLLSGIEKGPGMAHTLIYDPELPKIAEDVQVAARALRISGERLQKGEGPLGKLLFDEDVSKAIDDIVGMSGAAKEIVMAVQEGDGSLHQLVYDKGTAEALADVGAAARGVSDVMARVREGSGSLALLLSDPSVWESLKRVLRGAEESRLLKRFVTKSLEEQQEREKATQPEAHK